MRGNKQQQHSEALSLLMDCCSLCGTAFTRITIKPIIVSELVRCPSQTANVPRL